MKKKVITILSIGIFSVILWGSISLSSEYSTNLKLPIVFTDLPDTFAISSSSENEISLSISGKGWELAKLTFARDLDFSLSTGSITGKQTVELKDALHLNSWLPSNIQIIKVSPEILEYSIEKIKRKKVKIVPNIILDYKPGYALVSNITIQPDSVEIIGPESKVRKIGFVRTIHEEFTNLEKKTSKLLLLENIEDINFADENCQINFDVQKIVDKIYENIEVKTVNVPPSQQLLLFPGKLKVVLRGGINILGRLEESDIIVYVTYEQALSDTLGTIEPFIEVPDYSVLIDQKPRRLEYIIKKY